MKNACYKFDYVINFGFGRAWLAIILSKLHLLLKNNKTEVKHDGETWILVDGQNMFFCPKTNKHAHFRKMRERKVNDGESPSVSESVAWVEKNTMNDAMRRNNRMWGSEPQARPLSNVVEYPMAFFSRCLNLG